MLVPFVRLTEALERLVQLYDGWGKRDEAARWRAELEARKAPAREEKNRPRRSRGTLTLTGKTVAGESLRPSKVLIGPAPPRRSACAPGATSPSVADQPGKG
jgi:hypothetical protein